jgi:hypothetical protein
MLSATLSDRCRNWRSDSEGGILQVDFLADKFVLVWSHKGNKWDVGFENPKLKVIPLCFVRVFLLYVFS